MENVYHWMGLIVFWAAMLAIAIVVIAILIMVAGFLYNRIWMRTYLFQWHELGTMKKALKEKSYTDNGVDMALRSLKEIPRFKTHIFLPQLYEIVNKMRRN